MVSKFMASQDVRLSKFEADFKQQQSEMTNKIVTVLKAITERRAGTLPSDTVKNPKLGTHPVSSARSYPTMDPQCSTQIHSSINAITTHHKLQSDSHDDRTKENEEEERDILESHSNSSTPPDPSILFLTKKVLKFNSLFKLLGLDDDSFKEEPKAEGQEVEYSYIFPTRSELAYHKYLMCGPIPSTFLRNLIITGGCPSNLKIPCKIGYVHVEKAYIDINFPLNIMTRMMYNWIMRRKLNHKEDANGGISNLMGRIKGMHVFIGNFTYVIDFMIVEDISLIIDPRLSQVRIDKVAYKMPHKIEQYDSLSDLEKEHTKSVYLRNEEDKRRGVELYLMRKSLKVLRKFRWMILGGRFNQLSHVSSPLLSKPGEY
nr:retrotransposon Orf1 [Tanacetum cinerariifolium]